MTTQTLLAGLLMALATVLAVLTFLSERRARSKGLASGRALVAATLALVVCGGCLAALASGHLNQPGGLTDLQFALLLLTLALGWAILSWMSDFRRTTIAAQYEAAAHQARDLEILVQQRNAELSARLQDLEEARRTAEVANKGLQRALEELEQAASTDRLTGAWNRRRFEEAVLSEIALAHRRRDPLSLLMFDLDHFKRVNDTFGHGVGDVVLATTAQTVLEHLRLSDALIRWGGEEFLVMAPATRLDGAMGLAEKLRAAMAAVEFPNVGQVTMSLGVSEYALGEGLEEWIARTDQALYRAKAGGRNRVVAAPSPVHPDSASSKERSLVEMIWEDAYTSGHSLIDSQHRRLFHLASSLLSVLAEDRPLEEVSLRLQTLLAHTAQHFHDEESLLREARYPDLAEHSAAHTELLEKAGGFHDDLKIGKLDFGKLASFLTKDLVKDHILTEDQNYFAHLEGLSSP